MHYYTNITELNDSIDFLKIYDGNRPYYGGCQKWFKNPILRKAGCSIVAAANITAYTAKRIDSLRLFNYRNMSKENFSYLMDQISELIHPDPVDGVTSISYFNKEIIEFSRERGVFLKANVITTKDSLQKIKDFIKSALNEDKPIAMLMLKNSVLHEFEWHWMTITKIFENMNKSYLDFSTWGERRIFTLENFYNYSSFGVLSYFDILK